MSNANKKPAGRLLADLALVPLLVVDAACSGTQTASDGDGTAGAGSGGRRITVAVENAYLPFNYLDPDTGEPTGWDYEVIEEICRRLDCEPAFEDFPWEPMIQAVSDGQFDMAGNGITITSERAEIVDFSDGYINIDQRLLVRIDETRFADDALAEDTEEYLRDAQRLAGHAFEYDWDDFLAAAEEHVGPGLSAQLRRLDPVEAAVRDATENLKAILGQSPVTAIANEHGDTGTMPDAIVQFCLDHDLLEVLYSLQHYSYTSADLRRDRYPGFFHRRLRPLALSGEQLARGILDARAERGHEKSLDHHRSGYRDFVKILGQDSSWLAPFSDLRTSDSGQGDLDQRAVRLAEAAHAVGARRDDVIANTLAAAVATRNLVSHQHRLLSSHKARTLAGPCADAVVLIWLTARERRLV